MIQLHKDDTPSIQDELNLYKTKLIKLITNYITPH